MKANKWLVYLLRCSDNSLYCGISNNLKNRLVNHNSGKGARYTRSRRPVEIVGISPKMTKSDALKLEYRIKQLPADDKLSELTREENGMTLKQDVKALQKEIKALEKKLALISKAVEKSATSKPAKKSTAKSVKGKVAKAGSVKKAPVKRISSKPTATDQVLKVIKGSKKGVDTATLMKKTGFDKKKVWNILQRTYKMGRIKRVGKGVYVVV